MYVVTITITATRKAYAAHLCFTDSNGKVHSRDLEQASDRTENSNFLQAAIDALKILQRPCLLEIRTSSDYLVGPVRNGWLREWEKNGWKNARGKEVKNQEQWKALLEALAPHSYKFVKQEDGNGA